jgi:hypothetical protein
MSGTYTADLPDLQAWARSKMANSPDFIIGDNYLRRWWIVPRNNWCNLYLHEILHSDDDRALHDHPWDNTSFLIEGSYIEVTPEGEFLREAGAVVSRPATASHRIVIPDGGRAVSLFMTGPQIREWGFHCPQGWRHWKEFVDARSTGKVGRGCE